MNDESFRVGQEMKPMGDRGYLMFAAAVAVLAAGCKQMSVRSFRSLLVFLVTLWVAAGAAGEDPLLHLMLVFDAE